VVTAGLAELINPELLVKAGIELVVVTGEGMFTPLSGVRTVPAAEFLADGTPAGSATRPNVWDTSCIVLTSGTTGPSKLVQIPWGVMHSGGERILPVEDLTPDDVWYQPLPTFHAAARFGITLMALCGGQLVQRETFSLTSFWADVREYGCTVTNMSPYSKLLLDQPERDDDADNPMRAAVVNPMPRDPDGFAKRFGLALSASYGTSELGIPISAGWDVSVPGSCGRPKAGWPGVHIRIVDEHDDDVPVGEVGELVIRTDEPWGLTSGYFDNPEATAEAWRNGWFHIGDGMRQDADGNLFFHDRIKDSIRRRGENISSFEVEAEVNAHPAVLESAAVAVRTDGAEDELKVFVVRDDGAGLDGAGLDGAGLDGAGLDGAGLCEFLAERVARFMVPRYVEFVDTLPKTEASGRIKKSELRNRGNGPATWDREAGGRR
jgi:crotonobetaine/carnitine-CoA ligase